MTNNNYLYNTNKNLSTEITSAVKKLSIAKTKAIKHNYIKYLKC